MLWAAECQSHLQGDSKAALVGDAGGGDTPEAVVVLIWLWSRDEGFRAEGFWQLPERVARESANLGGQISPMWLASGRLEFGTLSSRT